MLSGLDPHSSCLDPEAFKELREGTQGASFGGLGIEIGSEDGLVKVIAPSKTPRRFAPASNRVTVVKIDEVSVRSLSINETVKRMRGKPGTNTRAWPQGKPNPWWCR